MYTGGESLMRVALKYVTALARTLFVPHADEAKHKICSPCRASKVLKD